MKNWYTISVLTTAFLLGALATAIISGCQRVPQPAASGSTEAEGGEPGDNPSSPDGEPSGVASEEVDSGIGAARAADVLAAAVDNSANGTVPARDWPQWGGNSYHNNTPIGKNIPIEWKVGEFDRQTQEWIPDGAHNIKWVARLGSQTYGNPVVANERVERGTFLTALVTQGYN